MGTLRCQLTQPLVYISDNHPLYIMYIFFISRSMYEKKKIYTKAKGHQLVQEKGNILFMIMKYPKIYLGIT